MLNATFRHRTMKVPLSRAVLALLALATSSPNAAASSDTAEANPTATFAIGVEDTVGFGKAVTQTYRLGPSESIAASTRVKRFHWAAKEPKTVKLMQDAEVFIFATTEFLSAAPPGASSSNFTCANSVAFTPRPRTDYVVVQAVDKVRRCRLTVVDRATQLRPEDLREVKSRA